MASHFRARSEHEHEHGEESIGLLETTARATSVDLEQPLQQPDLYEKHSSRSPLFTNLTSFTKRFLSLRFSLRNVFVALLPSFIILRYFPTHPHAINSPLRKKVHKTTWLDGLRGVAAMVVVAYHLTGEAFVIAGHGYGSSDAAYYFLQLPIVRIIYSGTGAVCIFFVISGYALSVKPVELMTQHHAEGSELMRSFASSTFRRFFRLYLPAMASTIVPFLFLYSNFRGWSGFGTMKDVTSGWTGHETLQALQDGTRTFFYGPESETSFPSMVGVLIEANFNMTTILAGDKPESYLSNLFNGVLWTIPIEYRASLLLFLVQIAVCELRPSARLAITAILMVFSVWADRFEMILFLGGFLFAQLDPIMVAWEASLSNNRTRWGIYVGSMTLLFILGLYFASYPDVRGPQSLGYVWLSTLIPSVYSRKMRWWPSNGALLVVFAVSRLTLLARFFASPLIRYFGQVSFSLYLLHILAYQLAGVPTLYAIGAAVGNLDHHNPFMLYFAFGFGMLSTFVAGFWWADVFWRFVDIPSIEFARWLEGKLRIP